MISLKRYAIYSIHKENISVQTFNKTINDIRTLVETMSLGTKIVVGYNNLV